MVSWYYKIGLDSPMNFYIGKVMRVNSGLVMIRYIKDPVFHFKKGALYSIDLSFLLDAEPAGDSNIEDINAAPYIKSPVFNYSQFKISDKKKLLNNGTITSYKDILYKIDTIRALKLDNEHLSLSRFLVPITPFSSMDKNKVFDSYRKLQLSEIKGGNYNGKSNR